MMAIPTNINSQWIASLKNPQLVEAEAQLYDAFHTREIAEKSRAGARYVLLQGPSDLVNAWQQWLMLNNEARTRGVLIRRTHAKSKRV
jgi:hypothetical protein